MMGVYFLTTSFVTCVYVITLDAKNIVTLEDFPSLVVFLAVNFRKFLRNRNLYAPGTITKKVHF